MGHHPPDDQLLAFGELNRRIGRVLRQQLDHAPALVQPLHHQLAFHQGDHDAGGARRLRAVHDQRAAGENAGSGHGVPGHLHEEGGGRIGDEALVQVQLFQLVVLDGRRKARLPGLYLAAVDGAKQRCGSDVRLLNDGKDGSHTGPCCLLYDRTICGMVELCRSPVQMTNSRLLLSSVRARTIPQKNNEVISAMARRQKQQTLLDIALAGNWKVSAFLALAIALVVFILLPTVTSPILKAVTQGVKPLGLLLIAIFGLIALAKLVKAKLAESKTSVPGFIAEPQLSSVDNPPASSSSRLDAEWNAFLPSNQVSMPREKPQAWTLDLIQDIEWKKFEELSTHFYLESGIHAETTPLGADGGIDIKLYQDDSGRPTSIVQCKAWNSRLVGVKQLREFLGVMSHENIAKGFYMTSGDFSLEAREFAQAHSITLITGEMLMMMIKRLPEDAQSKLLAIATEGDYSTPSCPTCGIKMKKRSGNRGDFWGCGNYPKCRQTLHMRA